MECPSFRSQGIYNSIPFIYIEHMKISIPLSAGDISLAQFCSFHAAKSDLERIMAITGKSRKLVEGFKAATISEIISSFEWAMNHGASRHENTFVIEGMRLGFIPDLNSISLKEHIDLDTYSNMIWKKDHHPDYTHLPDLMSILFRPVKGMLGNKYEIEEYDGSRKRLHMDRVMQIPLDRINGALVFFSTIVKECALSGAESLIQEMKMEMEMEASLE